MFAVAGISVSTDSTEALREFLVALPADSDLAYVVVQLAAAPMPPFTAQTFGAIGRLIVVDVEDGISIEPNHVYIVPTEQEYVLQAGALCHVEHARHAQPFNRFLVSLAEERRMLARGIVLSGNGMDAAEGLLEIRRRGGLAFAQDPLTAKYAGMPAHVIAERAVDFVLSPLRIAEELVARTPGRANRDHTLKRDRPESLRAQLRDARARQQAMIERHIASNQDLTVANEELRAANEELHAMNDELQSSREQMHVVTEELQHQNAALDAANDDLMNVLASVEIPLVIVDAERRVRRYLPSARGLVNLIPHDVGRPIRHLQAKIQAPLLDEWIAEVIESGAAADYEVRDGEGRWRRLQIKPYRSAEGRSDGALVSLVDIDALKHLIDESNAARDRAAAMFETVPAPIVVLDQNLEVESANRAFYQFFEADRAQSLGRGFVEMGCARDSAALRARLERALADGQAFHGFDVEYTTAHAAVRVVSFDGSLVRSERDERSLLLVLQDETARRRREDEHARALAERVQRFLNEAGRMLLSESVESHSALEKLAHMAVPALGEVCMIDVACDDGEVVPVALACQDDVPADALIQERLERGGANVVSSVVRDGRSLLEAELDEAALARVGGTRAKLLRESGARSYLCVPLQGRGTAVGALSLASARRGRYGADEVALAESLGQRAGMALETARLYRAAHEAVQLRDEFLAIASHELRTPLTALSLQLENLQSLLPPPTNGRDVLAEKVGHALRYTARLGRLIDSLLAVSRIMAGHFTLRLDDVDLSEIAREVVERMRTDAARAHCTLELQTSGPVRGHWDAMRLDQIVTNLLTNAFRYAAGTTVCVSVNAQPNCAVLAVEDAGPGIARERLPLIFERYEIAGERTTSGLGLGLYIIRQIAEAHGGRVHVETEVGQGARFVVELPFEGKSARSGASKDTS